MTRALLVLSATLALGGCTFPQNTKMEPVGETQMQTANPAAQPAAAPDKQSTKRSGSSTNSTT